MALQNRVDPFGNIGADTNRGLFTGNRGILHDDAQRLVRSHTSKAWITCVLEWKGIRREVMSGRKWTELFFLDEAVAFAAGHRPCAYCRRGAYNDFVAAWSLANPELAPKTGRRAPVIDAVLHAQRRHRDGSKRTYTAEGNQLPVGAMYIDSDGAPAVVVGRTVGRRWSYAGYEPPRDRPHGQVQVLTPRSTVAALATGYTPTFHPSAFA